MDSYKKRATNIWHSLKFYSTLYLTEIRACENPLHSCLAVFQTFNPKGGIEGLSHDDFSLKQTKNTYLETVYEKQRNMLKRYWLKWLTCSATFYFWCFTKTFVIKHFCCVQNWIKTVNDAYSPNSARNSDRAKSP